MVKPLFVLFSKLMKHPILVVVIAFTSFSAVCATVESSPLVGGSNVSVVIDKDTGCEYFQSSEGFLYPRKASDGFSHKGCKDAQQSFQCDALDPTPSDEMCIITLPEGTKVGGNMGTGYTYEILPGTSLSEGCFN